MKSELVLISQKAEACRQIAMQKVQNGEKSLAQFYFNAAIGFANQFCKELEAKK